MRNKTLQQIGKLRNRTAAQVTLRWLIQQPKVAVIPRSSNPEHQRLNLAIDDFEVTREEMLRIAGLSDN